jgi:hypothetical protein
MLLLDLIKLGVYHLLNRKMRRRSVFSSHADTFLEHANRPVQGTTG